MKRIAFIFDRVAHYHRDLFQHLEAELKKHGVELVLLSGASDEGSKGRVGLKEKVISNEYKYRFSEHSIGPYTVRNAGEVLDLIDTINPTVVVCMGHVGNITHWRLLYAGKRSGYKIAAWQCGYEYNPGRVKSFVLAHFVPKFAHHLAYHSNARDYALAHGARSDQITLMHNTINEERIIRTNRREARQLLVQRHPEIGDRKILLFVGAVLQEKRIEVILDAMDQLNRQDVVLVLVGDGDHLPKIRSACMGRHDVVITGSIIERVGSYFDAAEVYLLPGTGGLGINEAMAHGLPVIAGFADGSADDLVVDGENGFRLRNGTAQEMAGFIARILDDQDMAQKMGQTSLDWISGKFAFKRFIDRITTALIALV